MASEVSKKDFLKRYLGSEKDNERKKKKKSKHVKVKPKANVPCLKIYDEDISLKSINFGDKADEDEDDEAPVVAEIIDDRPVEVKIKELYESSRWKKIDNNESSKSDDVHSLQKPSSYERNVRDRHDSDTDLSPLREQKGHSDSDISPPRSHKQSRTTKQNSDSDISPPRSHKHSKTKHDSSSDISPPRHRNVYKDIDSVINSSKRHDSGGGTVIERARQAKHKTKRHDSDSDQSPPRHQIESKKHSHIKNSSEKYNHSPISDESTNLRQNKNQKSRHSDSDLSPPRSSSELSFAKEKSKRLDKTLSGLKAGLQNSKSLQHEVQDFRKREKTHLNMLGDEISGRNASTIVRDRKTGLKRDLNQEQDAKDKEEKKAKEYHKKYEKWGKGTDQSQDHLEKIKDDLYEMSKPLARYKDDADLDERLRSVIRDDDPMSEYIKKKRQKDAPSYPVYSGPPAPPNRFGIQPGYRWDGVDRSNGFEKKYFEKINSNKAVQDEAYLWSVQDM